MSAPEEVLLLREATQEAHAAMKDLKAAMKEARELLDKLAADKFAAQISAEVQAGLAGYKETLEAAIETATASVFDRFDTIANIMTGKGKPADFEELAKRELERRGQ